MDNSQKFLLKAGRGIFALLRGISGRIRRISWRIRDILDPSGSFLTEGAILINSARIKHLENFKVLFQQKRTLELGAGIGVFSKELAHQSKALTVTEGRNSLIRVLRKNLKQNQRMLLMIG